MQGCWGPIAGSKLECGNVLYLTPVTTLGENITNQNGSIWVVNAVASSVGFSDQPGPWLQICPIDEVNFVNVHARKNFCRWIRENEPNDFTLEVIADDPRLLPTK